MFSNYKSHPAGACSSTVSAAPRLLGPWSETCGCWETTTPMMLADSWGSTDCRTIFYSCNLQPVAELQLPACCRSLHWPIGVHMVLLILLCLK
ncbi:hypothetical protein GDO78_003412 [Eleutherodactylus coqui]|uniref:Uncharacterized protein n=1 Tax=Eleutherodactylus coqui TaxID=57060 RepID=A0A8J6EU00_ELECQ|nr:hypothetical protein GDO78_003412 [Eleutherodactylus coqui]